MSRALSEPLPGAPPNSTSRLDAAQAVVVGVTFSILLAGSNAISPLLPVYRDVLAFDPVLISLTFVCYVAVLASVLLLIARSRVVRFAPVLLVASLGITLISDTLLSLADPATVLLGRGIAGIALGIGTGAAAALMVAAIGDRGRALVATGNLVGAVLGTGASLLWILAIGNAATHWVFLSHGALCALIAIALVTVLVRRRQANAAAFAPAPPVAPALDALPPSETAPSETDSSPLVSRRVLPYVVGTLGWFTISLTIVFAPSLFADVSDPWVGAVGNLLVLAASAAGQLASPAIARFAPRSSGLVAMTLGASALVVAALADLPALAIIGFAVLGYGIGLSYRLCLVTLTLGLRPERQGTVSSLYSAISYAAAGAGILAVGGAGSLLDLPTAVIAGYVVAAVCAAALAFVPGRPVLAHIAPRPTVLASTDQEK